MGLVIPEHSRVTEGCCLVIAIVGDEHKYVLRITAGKSDHRHKNTSRLLDLDPSN